MEEFFCNIKNAMWQVVPLYSESSQRLVLEVTLTTEDLARFKTTIDSGTVKGWKLVAEQEAV